jgi:hypothetical protein
MKITTYVALRRAFSAASYSLQGGETVKKYSYGMQKLIAGEISHFYSHPLQSTRREDKEIKWYRREDRR